MLLRKVAVREFGITMELSRAIKGCSIFREFSELLTRGGGEHLTTSETRLRPKTLVRATRPALLYASLQH